VFLPGYKAAERADNVARPVGLKHIDHVVGNVGWGEMNRWVDFYRDALGFGLYQHFDDKDIGTEYSALMSKVMSNGNVRVKFPINEPAAGRRKSQIEEYLEFYGGPVCSTLRSLPPTSSTRFRSCAIRASNSSVYLPRITTIFASAQAPSTSP
jgi:4-hydroxyphenylpyruvate dioxygenase